MEHKQMKQTITFKVTRQLKNFLLSPMMMILLSIGSSFRIVSSSGTGATFSPPAVIISSRTTDHIIIISIIILAINFIPAVIISSGTTDPYHHYIGYLFHHSLDYPQLSVNILLNSQKCFFNYLLFFQLYILDHAAN